jgi:sterol desaturase/sphingolipid hydroxylase (fatty acid hydroxylase superfamily)
MAFLSILYPIYFILKVLFSSLITTLYICKLNNKTFFNTDIYSKIYLENKIIDSFKLVREIIFYYVFIHSILSKYYLHEENLPLFIRITQNFYYILLLEFYAYIYHRLSHEIKYIYKNSHYIHHKNIDVYPVDFLEFDKIDNIAQTLYVNLPLYFVPMNIYDYAIIYYIYATCAFLIHSDILTNHHKIHHLKFKYNYCLLLPIFDILFGTYYYERNMEKDNEVDILPSPIIT